MSDGICEGSNTTKGDRQSTERNSIPVLTWKSNKWNTRTGPTYRTVCLITRRTCRLIFGEGEKELLY
jgi:hypothetical protein